MLNKGDNIAIDLHCLLLHLALQLFFSAPLKSSENHFAGPKKLSLQEKESEGFELRPGAPSNYEDTVEEKCRHWAKYQLIISTVHIVTTSFLLIGYVQKLCPKADLKHNAVSIPNIVNLPSLIFHKSAVSFSFSSSN